MAESNVIFHEISPDKPYKRFFKDEGGQGRNPSRFFNSESTVEVTEAKEKREVSLSQIAARKSYIQLLTNRNYQVELLIHILANAENFRSAIYDFENALRWVENRLKEIDGRE